MLNNKNRDRIYISVTAAMILAAVLAYILFPVFQTDINRTVGKLNMDDSKGLLIFLYGQRDASAAWSVLIMAEQTLAPFLSKGAAVASLLKYFGIPLGMLLCTAGIAVGLLATFCIARAAVTLINKFVRLDPLEALADRFGMPAVFIISLIPFWPSAMSGYLAGLAGMKLKKFLPAAVLGQAVCLTLFFLPKI
jgi:uncharacterized membrane protein YdjX (TVP38/TMEM64 family)